MALNINIHTPNGLVPISPELTYKQIVDVLGYTPLDASNYVTYDSISDVDNSAFYVVDSQQHILAQIDEDGLKAAIMTVNGKDVESGLIYDIKELADDAFYIVDSQSNVIAKIGENGLETTNVIAQTIITNSIESPDSELYIVDTNNRPILSVDANGLETTNIVATDAVLSQHSVVDHIEDYEIHITEEERQSWNSKSKFDSISEDDNTTLYINDKNDKTIAKFDADGLTVTNVSASDVTVGDNKSVLSHINNTSIHITDAERSTWNTVTSKASKTELSEHINDTDKHIGDEISLDDDSTLYINDKNNNTIVKVNSEGLIAAEVILQADKEQYSLLEHVTNTDIHIQDGERESWNAKIDSSTLAQKLAEKTDKTDFNSHIQDTDLHIGDEISLDDNTTLYINDAGGNVIAKFDASGLNVGDLFLNNQHVATEEYVNGKVTGLFEFKGSISSNAEVPAVHEVGDTYRITVNGEYAGKTCEEGDMLVCIVNGSTANNKDWTVLQQNWTAVDGSSTLKWGEAVTLATIGGVTIDAKLPAISSITSKIATGNNSSTSNTTTEVSNPYINHVEGSIVNSSVQFTGANTATVKATNGVITIDSGVTSTEKSKWDKVTDKVDTSVFNKEQTVQNTSIATLFADKLDISVYNADKTALDKTISDISTAIGTKANQTDFEDHISDTDLHIGDEISLDDDSTLYISDKDGAIIAKFSESGFDAKAIRQDDNAVASKVVVDASTDSPYIDEDGTLHLLPDVDTNTTYTFKGGTNKFTVTPSEGSQYDVSVIPSMTVDASATDDDVVILTGKPGTNGVSYDAKHAQKGPAAGYTSKNTTTDVSGYGVSKTIKIPQITVDKYGHVTAAADTSVTITIPRLPSFPITTINTASKYLDVSSKIINNDSSLSVNLKTQTLEDAISTGNDTGVAIAHDVATIIQNNELVVTSALNAFKDKIGLANDITIDWEGKYDAGTSIVEAIKNINNTGSLVDTSVFNVHITDTSVHLKDDERTKWNKVVDKVDTSVYNAEQDVQDTSIAALFADKVDTSVYNADKVVLNKTILDISTELDIKANQTDFNQHVSDTNLHLGDEINLEDDSTLYITDKDSAIIAKFSQSGFDAKLIRQDDNVVASKVIIDELTELPYIAEDGTLHLTATVNGLTIKGTMEPSKLVLCFPQNSKINDAYVVSRDALSGEFPENAKKGDLWVCVKASEVVCDGEKCVNTEPVFNFSGVNLCGPAGKDGTSVTIKGSKDTEDELPEEGNTNGDGYIVQGILFVWDGTKWIEAGEIKGPKGDPGPQGPAGEYTNGANIDITDNVISAKGYLFNETLNSFAEGCQTRAYGNNSHAEGDGTAAEGVASHAEGYESLAEGVASHAEGSSHAQGRYSHAEGWQSHTEGENSHSEGYKTTATGKSSHSEGNGVEAIGVASHAEGWHNIDVAETYNIYTVQQVADDNTKYHIVSDFEGPTGGSDGLFYLKHGMIFLYNNNYYYVTEVFYDDTNTDNPTSFRLNQSVGKTDTNNFNITLLVGKSIGKGSHIEGCNTVAYGQYAHAEGNTTRATGVSSHTEGAETSAIGGYSHAEGRQSTAIGAYSHAEGMNTIAANSSEHAEGRYNVSNTGSKEKDKTISSIGIGTSNTDRKNALEVMQNGDMYVYGLGDYDGTNPETATTLQQCINDGVGSQSFGGYVYIEKYDKTNFENALKTALSDVKTAYDNGTNKNAVILDCTYFTGTHVLSSGFTGFNLYTPVKLVFGSIKVVFNNPGDNNLFNIYHNDISIVGINRNTDVSQIATGDTAPNGATLFIMGGDENNSDNLNGYHIKSSGFKNILIDSITLKGKRSEMGEYYQSTSNPISGIGGIYIEKGDPTSTATSGLTCNNVRINNVLISDTKAHGIYINTPILSSITNTRLSGCGGHGIYILGGTSINIENVYASSGNFAGFCIQNASYVQLANCVAETFGIGFLIRGSNSVTLHCPGVEQTTNFGRYPWRNTLTGEITSPQSSNKIYGLGLLHTGSTTIIKDVVSGLDTCFIGYGIYITGGDGINVFSPYIKSIGQSKSSTIGYPSGTTPSAQLNFISVVGEANLVNIINPHFKMSDEELSIIQTIKNEIKIGKDAKYVDISYSTDSSPLKEKIEGVLKYTTNNTDIACIYTENGENINTITLKIDNVYESLYAKTMYAENGFYETSDARKKDIQGELPLDKAYDFIRNCEPILYNLKGSDKTQIGLIAQEVREFFPEIVNEDDEGYLSLDYAKLTVVILRVLKDLIDQKK